MFAEWPENYDNKEEKAGCGLNTVNMALKDVLDGSGNKLYNFGYFLFRILLLKWPNGSLALLNLSLK